MAYASDSLSSSGRTIVWSDSVTSCCVREAKGKWTPTFPIWLLRNGTKATTVYMYILLVNCWGPSILVYNWTTNADGHTATPRLTQHATQLPFDTTCIHDAHAPPTLLYACMPCIQSHYDLYAAVMLSIANDQLKRPALNIHWLNSTLLSEETVRLAAITCIEYLLFPFRQSSTSKSVACNSQWYCTIVADLWPCPSPKQAKGKAKYVASLLQPLRATSGQPG
jgi:hypothetical protein